VRKVIVLAAVAGLLVTLAGCSVSAPSGPCTPTATSGEASKLITATGEFSDQPEADFPTPLISDELEVSIIDEGDGPVIQDGDLVEFYATQFDPETGELVGKSASYDDATYNSVSGPATTISQIFQCIPVGSRIGVVAPLGADESSVVFVLDIENAMPARATGKIELPERGMPSIVTAPDGRPGFTILDEDAPTELRYSTLITGNGEKVKKGDTLILQYTAVDWDSSAVIGSTWAEDELPKFAALKKFDAADSTGLSAGVVEALVGKTVGSQVLVVLPPSSYEDGTDLTPSQGATVVAVYDILGISK
jgi:peptidylprolyl isomerase